MIIKATNLISPHFNAVWKSKQSEVILKGGRSSTKSSVVSLWLVKQMLKFISKGMQVNAVIIMDHDNHIRDTTFLQLQWAINELKATDDFITHTSPFRIIHKRTQSTFYFYGDDDPNRLKSNTVPNIYAVWYEEAANFKSDQVFDDTNPTFIRHVHPRLNFVKIFYSYNPPKNPYDWINQWIEKKEKDPNCLIDHSTYLDVKPEFIDKQTMQIIDSQKQTDYDFYRWRWLGQAVGLGNSVWKCENFQQINEIDDVLDGDFIQDIAFSSDVGHEVSATTTGCWIVTYGGKCILWNTYYYSPQGRSNKKAPSELAKDIIEFEKDCVGEFADARVINDTIDSAEGGLRNQIKLITGHEPHPVHKLKKATMIEMTQDLLAQGRVYILKRSENDIFLSQAQKYRWDEKTLETDNPEVIKVDDHTPDMFQYFVVDNAQRLRIRR